MRVTFFVHTSGQAYLWSHVALILKERGHEVSMVVRGNDNVRRLLESYDIPFASYGKVGTSKYGKVLRLPAHLATSVRLVARLNPDIIVGTGIIEAWTARLLGKRCIIFDDSESIPFLERLSWRYLANDILTPVCFLKEMGKKQVRFRGYKELAYLHPNQFSPDPSIYKELGIGEAEKFVILRFGAFEAVHDVHRRGFPPADKHQLVQQLSKYARVFISSEGSLPADLQPYRLPIPYHRIHHALYYAELVVADTGTTTSEAAVLGTPAIICGSFVHQFGNFIELEREYGLIFCFEEAAKSIDKALELIQQPNLKELWAAKRRKLLTDKIDVAEYMAQFIQSQQKVLGRTRTK